METPRGIATRLLFFPTREFGVTTTGFLALEDSGLITAEYGSTPSKLMFGLVIEIFPPYRG
ncbi:hypothetical protein GCM10009604_04410 [Corynebacterium aurimucosum]